MLFPPPYVFSDNAWAVLPCELDRRNKKTTRRLGGSHPVSRALGLESSNQLDVAGASAVLEIEDLKNALLYGIGRR